MDYRLRVTPWARGLSLRVTTQGALEVVAPRRGGRRTGTRHAGGARHRRLTVEQAHGHPPLLEQPDAGVAECPVQDQARPELRLGVRAIVGARHGALAHPAREPRPA